MSVTIDGFWADDRIGLFNTASDYTLQFTITYTSVHGYVFTARCLVAASTADVPLPQPQLPAYHSNSSQLTQSSKFKVPCGLEVSIAS
jgi:hypothetical protein